MGTMSIYTVLKHKAIYCINTSTNKGVTVKPVLIQTLIKHNQKNRKTEQIASTTEYKDRDRARSIIVMIVVASIILAVALG